LCTVLWDTMPYSSAAIHQHFLGSTVMSVNLYETARRRITGDGCIRKSLPLFLPYLPTYLLTYLPTYLFTYLLTHSLTYSVEHSPCEANRFSASQDILCVLWNPKFITTFTSARHLSLTWARSIQLTYPPPQSSSCLTARPAIREIRNVKRIHFWWWWWRQLYFDFTIHSNDILWSVEFLHRVYW